MTKNVNRFFATYHIKNKVVNKNNFIFPLVFKLQRVPLFFPELIFECLPQIISSSHSNSSLKNRWKMSIIESPFLWIGNFTDTPYYYPSLNQRRATQSKIATVEFVNLPEASILMGFCSLHYKQPWQAVCPHVSPVHSVAGLASCSRPTSSPSPSQERSELPWILLAWRCCQGQRRRLLPILSENCIITSL